MKKTLGVIALTLVASIAGAADKPGEWKPLLDAKLSQFDVYLSYRGDQIMSVLKGTAPADLKPIGLNPPGQNVFTMIEQGGKPVLRISGEIYGCAPRPGRNSRTTTCAPASSGAKRNGSRASPSSRTRESSITAAARSASTTGSPGRSHRNSRSSSTASASTGGRPRRLSTSVRMRRQPGRRGAEVESPGAVDGVFRLLTTTHSRARTKTGPGEWNTAGTGVFPGPLRAHRQRQGGHGAEERALQGWRTSTCR